MKTFNKIYSLLFLLLLSELVLGLSGQWSNIILGISVRKTLYLLCVLLSIFYCTVAKKYYLPYIYFVVVFFVFYGLFLPAMYDGNLGYALLDISSFVGIMLSPVLVAPLNKNSIHRLKGFFFKVLFLFACIHIIIWSLGMIDPNFTIPAKFFISNYMSFQSDDVTSTVIIAQTPDGGYRVLLASSISLLMLYYMSISKLVEKKCLKNYFLILFSSFSLYTTWGVAIYMVPLLHLFFFIPLVKILNRFNVLNGPVISAFILALVLFTNVIFSEWVSTLLSLFSYERNVQFQYLIEMLSNHAILGSGFGMYPDFIRSEIAPWTYELSMLSLYYKIGFIGFICILTLIIISTHKCKNNILLISFVMSIIPLFSTNPFLFSLIGVLITTSIIMEGKVSVRY